MSNITIGVEETEDEDFKFVSGSSIGEGLAVKKYKSEACGLEVVHAETEGPLLKAFIVVATAAEDDLGLPHCLEHLIFMGSEKYPQNGTLRLLANYCLANGATAWTDIDHTCYTITTAGQEGFTKILPIYLEHIFYPTLSEDAFNTEVHHVNGAGVDGGLIYSQAFALEFSGVNKAFRTMMKAAYPSDSGYYHHYTGTAASIREFCTNQKVKDYHAKYYHPKNAQVIVTGMIDEVELFQCLRPVVAKFVEKNRVPEDWKKLWQEVIPPLTEPIEETAYFPAVHEDGEEILVLVGFHGSTAAADFEENYAIRILMEYLTDSSESPLDAKFINTENPIAKSISFSTVEATRSLFYLRFEGVRPEVKGEVVPALREVFQETLKNFNLDAIKTILQANYAEELSASENTPHNSMAYLLIADFLYDSTADDGSPKHKLSRRLLLTSLFKRFLMEPAFFWTNLIQKYALDQNYVVVYMIPSVREQEKIKSAEESRVKARSANFSSEQLAEFDKKIEDSIAESSKAIENAEELVQEVQIMIPPARIYYHEITSYKNPSFPSGIHCNFFLDDIHSRFAYITVLMDTSQLTNEQQRYLPIFIASLTDSAIKVDETENSALVPSSTVTEELDKVFTSYTAGLGVNGGGGAFKHGSFSHLLAFNAQLDLKKLGEGVRWLRRIFWKREHQVEQVKRICAKLAGEIIGMKGDGPTMAKTLLRNLVYCSDSNTFSTSIFRQQILLREIWSTIEQEAKSKSVIGILKSIQNNLNKPENVNVHVATNLSKAKQAYDLLKQDGRQLADWRNAITFNDQPPVKKLSNEPDYELIRPKKDPNGAPLAIITGNPMERFTHLSQCIPSIKDFNDPQLAALVVSLQYFCQNEGPFSKRIRSTGLCYEIYMEVKPNEGLLYLHMHRSNNMVQAYKEACSIVQEHCEKASSKAEAKPDVWKKELLDVAKNALIFEVIEGENTLIGVVTTSLLSYYRNIPLPDKDRGRKIVEDISRVSLDSVTAMTKTYIKTLFMQPCSCAVFGPSEAVSDIAEQFSGIGKNLTDVPVISSSFLAQW